MKASLFVLSTFATLGAVHGLPTTDASVTPPLAKREWPIEDYRKCLMDDFYNDLRDKDEWKTFQCPGNKQVRFMIRQQGALSTQRGPLNYYKSGRDELLELIRKGDTHASRRICFPGHPTPECCEISVQTTLHPEKDYVDCLKGGFKRSAYDKNSWNSVVCPNKNIEFSVTRNDDPQWQSARDCYHEGADYLQKMMEQGKPNGKKEICVPGDDKDRPYCCYLSYLSFKTRESVS